ncbi:MAG: lipid A biosynthesis acyltransferase [Lewinellaceae bacterium]|nr:lipid A biosynthesis acyltransferase [Lewinellaceae bacterium]
MIGYLTLRLVAELFRFIPFRVVYLLSDGMAFLLYHVVGYRKKVVYGNLRRAFPEKSDAEIRAIARDFYHNLMDMTLESIKTYTAPLKEIHRRCPTVNPELLNRFLDKGQSVILTGSHYGNWEYSGLTMPPDFHGATITAFKQIKNKYLDRYVNQSRSRTGMELVSMDDLFRTMRRRAGEPAVYLLLADQSPSSRKSAHWVDLLGVDTASLPGADVLSRKFNYPVLYYHIMPVRRGFYEITFSLICENPAEMGEMEITRRYTKVLEADVRAKPEHWLWSHKRWKISREEQPAAQKTAP